jgi:general stress protein 26
MILKYSDFNNAITEGVIVIKRKYTEQYPTINKNLNAKIRNCIFKAVADKMVTMEELLKIVSKAGSKNAKYWFKQNGQYFKIVKGDTNTEMFRLTPQALKILNNL